MSDFEQASLDSQRDERLDDTSAGTAAKVSGAPSEQIADGLPPEAYRSATAWIPVPARVRTAVLPGPIGPDAAAVHPDDQETPRWQVEYLAFCDDQSAVLDRVADRKPATEPPADTEIMPVVYASPAAPSIPVAAPVPLGYDVPLREMLRRVDDGGSHEPPVAPRPLAEVVAEETSLRDMLKRVELAESNALAVGEIGHKAPRASLTLDRDARLEGKAHHMQNQQEVESEQWRHHAYQLWQEAERLTHHWLPALVTLLGVVGVASLAAIMLGWPVSDPQRPVRIRPPAQLAGIEADEGALYQPKAPAHLINSEPKLDPIDAARMRAEAMLARLPDHVAAPMISSPARLRFASMLITRTTEDTPLAIRIEPLEQGGFNGFVIVRGLPDDVRLSRGQRLRPGIWMLMPRELDDVKMSLPNDAERKIHLEAELIDDAGSVQSRRTAFIDVRPLEK